MFFRKKSPLPQVGAHAPDFRLARLGGGEVALADLLAAGPALFAFFKVSCPVCQMTLPFLDRIHAGCGLRVYGISQNDEPDTREFAQQYGLRFPILLDSEDDRFPASNVYGISHVPTTFLVEPDGMVGRVIEGWIKQEILWLGARVSVNPIGADDRVPEWKGWLRLAQLGSRAEPRYNKINSMSTKIDVFGAAAAIAKGMSVTLKEMLSPTVTEYYPDEPAKFEERFRGVHVLQRDVNGMEKCVACFLCAAACPSNCIYIEAAENTERERISGGERYAKVYNIDYNRCIFCGYCVEACPTDAITHGHGFEAASYNTSTLIKRKEDMLAPIPAGAVPPVVEPERPAAH